MYMLPLHTPPCQALYTAPANQTFSQPQTTRHILTLAIVGLSFSLCPTHVECLCQQTATAVSQAQNPLHMIHACTCEPVLSQLSQIPLFVSASCNPYQDVIKITWFSHCNSLTNVQVRVALKRSEICLTSAWLLFRKIGGDIQSHVNHHLVMCKNVSISVNVLILPNEYFSFSVPIWDPN
jgi:hypothetical protein